MLACGALHRNTASSMASGSVPVFTFQSSGRPGAWSTS
jgi:hypothetical protein